jgi:cytochrome c553
MNRLTGFQKQSRLMRALSIFGVSVVTPVLAQDAQQGAMLYMRLGNDVASCSSCHGPDPSQGRNNLLSAADNPTRLVKTISTVGVMGYLNAELSETNVKNIAAFLGQVVQNSVDVSQVRVWPWSLDFGTITPGQESAQQLVRISNPSSSRSLNVTDISANSADVLIIHECPADMLPLTSCEVRATMRPTSAGLHRASIRIAAGAQIASVGVVGYGATMPVSRLEWAQRDAVSFTATQGIAVSTTLTLSNTGSMPAVLGLTNISGDQASQFKLDAGCGNGAVVQAGTSCTLSVTYVPGLIAKSNAVLQLRSDQTNPSALRLQGSLTPIAPIEPGLIPPGAGSGGGCAYINDPSRSRDVTLLAALLAAALAIARKRRRTHL